MTRPLVIKQSVGTLLFIGKGDEKPSYLGPGAKYWKSRVLFLKRFKMDPHEIPKCCFDAIVQYLQDPEIKEKMSDWE